MSEEAPKEETGRKAERTANESAKDAKRRWLHDLRESVSTPSGRRVMWWVLSEARVFRTAFHENPRESAYREGFRDLGLLVRRALIEAAPESYATMEKEKGGLA